MSLSSLSVPATEVGGCDNINDINDDINDNINDNESNIDNDFLNMNNPVPINAIHSILIPRLSAYLKKIDSVNLENNNTNNNTIINDNNNNTTNTTTTNARVIIGGHSKGNQKDVCLYAIQVIEAILPALQPYEPKTGWISQCFNYLDKQKTIIKRGRKENNNDNGNGKATAVKFNYSNKSTMVKPFADLLCDMLLLGPGPLLNPRRKISGHLTPSLPPGYVYQLFTSLHCLAPPHHTLIRYRTYTFPP
eukprot:CAMPEP_0182471212 /NCGR_PEP_ID=MMETSP1319-20130603/19911_1 /TAXON_ID=172717 /ORGANISM="Bolidomonas pacifica, Strain RCC208" /LENGTH=248 /DNA_ID=CAMNT_0024671737 /DNA_START=228 /DNA_END=971 /DNA_ORIENTATION=+